MTGIAGLSQVATTSTRLQLRTKANTSPLLLTDAKLDLRVQPHVLIIAVADRRDQGVILYLFAKRDAPVFILSGYNNEPLVFRGELPELPDRRLDRPLVPLC